MKEMFYEPKGTSSINIFDKKSNKGWQADKNTVIEQMIEICEEYDRQGYKMSLRQIYYQMVIENYIPNLEIVYKKLSGIKGEAFYSGQIDWEIIEDRGRIPHIAGFDEDIKGALDYAVRTYRLDRQKGQNNIVEIWTEKDAISSILKKIANQFGIKLVVNKGYTSDTALYDSYVRFLEQIEEGKNVTILYFGDHDPSGLDMIRDIRERIIYMFEHGQRISYELEDKISEWGDTAEGQEFCDWEQNNERFWRKIEGTYLFNWRQAWLEANKKFQVIPIGITMEQIKKYNLPPNPAKLTDPRAKGYVKKFGNISWEVDALKPNIIESIVKQSIESVIDVNMYLDILKKEEEERNKIRKLVENLE